MTREDISLKVRKTIEETFDISEAVEEDDALTDFAIDSIDMATLKVELDGKFETPIPELEWSEMTDDNTVRDIIDLIEKIPGKEKI